MSTDLVESLLPWEAAPLVQVVCGLTVVLYIAGMLRGAEPGFWRALAFFTGVVLFYAVTQTYLDYYSQYLFFAHRAQHLVLHHLGPFLVALSAPASVLGSGLPQRLRAWRGGAAGRALRIGYRGLQQPVVAGVLFVGLIYLWLIPAIHFDAMLSDGFYWLMNWSMALDGLLFWWLILQRGEKGATPRLSAGKRILLLALIMPPQIALGAYITFSDSGLYSVYAVCGRAFPISPLVDQQLGGLITWIPAAMMSVIGALVLFAFRLGPDERITEVSHPDFHTPPKEAI